MRFIVKKLLNLLKPNENLLLGRWNLKHDINKCEHYILNQYADPGYFKSKKKIVVYINDQNL